MQISEIRSRLIKQREQILGQRNSTTTSWQKLQEPEVEFEENAAKEKMAGVLEQLDDREKQEIEQIDTALAKIRTGGFGMCASCGRQIAESRIKAIPWAAFCIECAEKQEQAPARAGKTDVWTSREFGTPMEPPDKLDPEKKSD